MTTRLSQKVEATEAPRPVFCIVGGAHQDLVVANDACAGRFTHVGATAEIGLEPDWARARIPQDPEWLIEWGKFYWGLDMAYAFRERGERDHLAAWERLVRSWIHNPPPLDESYTAARRIQNWIYAWCGFSEAPAFSGLTDGLAGEIGESLTSQVADLRGRLTPARNHRTIELYALLLFALAFPWRDEGGRLLDLTTGELHRNLMSDTRADGVHCEASTHYHMVALRSWVGARENARRFGIELPVGYDDRLEAACEFALHCHRPDGGIPAISDADIGCYGDVLAVAGEILGRPDFVWSATAGRAGEPPRRRNVSFPDGGYYVQRSGFGAGGTPFENERFLIFDCGPLGDGGHGHYDLLSVEIACGGEAVVVDPGRCTYAEGDPNLRRWFKGTAAHNTVVVDNLDQTPYRIGKPKGPVATGRILGRRTGPGLDVVVGEAESPCYEAIHRRRISFVADGYWIIEDLLHGSEPHRYDLRFHLSSAACGRVRLIERDEDVVVEMPRARLVMQGDAAPSLEGGWIAPEYGVRHRAPVVSAAVDGVAEARFITLVVPAEAAEDAPSVRLVSGQAGDLDGVTISVAHCDGVLDMVEFTAAGAWWSRTSARGECLAEGETSA